MPYINIKTGNPSLELDIKRELVSEISSVIVKVLNKNPEDIYIIIEEVNPENWGVGSNLLSETDEVDPRA